MFVFTSHRTDALIQETVRKKFKKSTVLTIAHRLQTVMDSDRILVLKAGSVVECDEPYLLLKNKNGVLFKMVQETETSSRLRRVARNKYLAKRKEVVATPHVDNDKVGNSGSEVKDIIRL